MPSVDVAQTFVRLGSETAGRLRLAWPGSDPGSRLFWAAANVGYTVMASALIDRIATVSGLAEVQAMLRVESFDILEAAAVSLAAHSAVSAVDLCSAAAWIAVQPARPGGKEADLKWVADPDQLDLLYPGHAAWVRQICSSADWQQLWQCRSQATHRTFKRTVVASTTTHMPYDDVQVGTVKVPADRLVHRSEQCAESWFRAFCAVVLPGEMPLS
jgi:hypothetical protein